MVRNENFVSGYDLSIPLNEPVNYDTKKQNCNELTYSPEECVVDTVVPSNKIVCSKTLSPITNNQIDYVNKNKNKKKSKNPTISLNYDFDLLSSFNNAQQNDTYKQNDDMDELKTWDELKTDVHSLNSIENDIMSNY